MHEFMLDGLGGPLHAGGETAIGSQEEDVSAAQLVQCRSGKADRQLPQRQDAAGIADLVKKSHCTTVKTGGTRAFCPVG